MKVCPLCRKTYADDSQSYCLDDGSVLSFVNNQPRAFVAPAAKSSGGVRTLLTLGFAVLVLIVIGALGVGTFVFFRSQAIRINELKSPPAPTPTKQQNVNSTKQTVSNSSSDNSLSGVNANASPSPSLSSPPAIEKNLIYTGRVINTSLKKSSGVTLTVTSRDNLFYASGQLDGKNLYGRFDNLLGIKTSCANGTPLSNVCVRFTGDLLLGDDGSGFPDSTKALFTMNLSISPAANRAVGDFQIGLIPKFERLGIQYGTINLNSRK